MSEELTKAAPQALEALRRAVPKDAEQARQQTEAITAMSRALTAAQPAQAGCNHVLYETADADRPKEICDQNGEVVLAMCKLCGKAESELEATQPAAQATRTTADTLREIKAASCKDCGASGYTDPGEADSPDGPGRPAVVCGACMGTGWRDGVHISDQQATPEPVQPFFVRDVAALLGVSVPDVCKALAHLGHGQRSTNMVISPDEALAVAEHIRPATPEPVGEVVGWSYEIWRQDQGEGGQSKWCREASDWEPPAASSFFRNIRPLTYADTHPAPGVPEIDYQALIHAAWGAHKYAQGTGGCIAFKHGAEWFRGLLNSTPAKGADHG